MVLSRNERNIRYSIRKFSIGVASVAVCCFFCASVAQAAETVSANPPIPQTVSSGDKEYEDAVQKVNREISDYMTSRLGTLDQSASGFSETLTKVRAIVEKYGDKIDSVSTKSMVEELGREAKKEIDEEIKLFQNRSGGKSTPKGPSLNDGLQGDDPSVGQGPGVAPQPGGQPSIPNQVGSESMPPKTADNPMPPKTPKESGNSMAGQTGNQPAPQPGGAPSGSSTDKPSGSPEVGNQSDKPAPSLSDTKEVQDLIKKGFQELEKLEKSLQELDEKAELPDEEFYGKQKTIWDDQKSTIRKSIKDFKDIVKDIASKYHKENYFKKYNSDFKDYQLYVQMEIMTRQVRDYLLRYPKDGDIIKEFESGMKQTASDNYSNLSGDNLKGYFEKNFRSAFEKIQETVRKLEKKAQDPKTPEKPQKSEQPKPSKPTEKDTNSSGSPSPGKKAQGEPKKQDKVAEAQKKVAEAEKKAKVQKEEDSRNYPTNTRKTIELEIAEAKVEVAKAELELAQAEVQTPQDTDKINTAKAKVETAKSKVETLEKIKSGHGRPQAGDQKPSMPAPDTKPNHQSQPESPRPDTNPAGDKRPSSEPTPTPQPEGKQPSTPKEPENKKPSLPSPEKPKNSKIFTATDGKTKVTVIFDHSVDADKLNIKEVTSKELVDTITGKVGGGTVRVFELSLSKNGKETHVNGERTVRLALGQTGSGVQVYHVKENGELEPIPSKVENGDIVFKTTHFSLFAVKTLSQKQDASMPGQDTPPTRAGKTQTKDTKPGKSQDKGMNHTPVDTSKGAVKKGNSKPVNGKKSLPYTGTASHLVLEILGLLSLTATAVFAKKRRK